MKTMRAKALASLLAGFVTLAGFSGCHASSAAMFSESATISASSAPQDSASSTTQISQTSEAGTYVQDDMTELMPQTYAYFTDLRLSADGAVEVVGLSQSGGVQLLRWTDDVWETAVESSQPAVANGALTVAADGTLWTVCRDDSGAYTLQSGTDPAAMQTIPVEALSQEEALPISLRLAADGKIFLTAQVGETTVFVLVDPATRQATTVTPGFYGSPAFYAEGSIYTFAAGSTSLSVLDATNGSVLQQYSLPLAEPLARASAAAIQQNCLIWADSNGIHQIALGGTLQQNLADNRSFALASSSFIVQQIVLDGQGNYWVSGVNAGGQAQIYRYRYDTQAAVASGGELVVWAMISQYAENVFFGKPCGLMDQTACAVGKVITIDFKEVGHPVVREVPFDLAAKGFALCISDTKGSHADLTDDYAAVRREMESVAEFFGKKVLRDVDEETFLKAIPEVRKVTGDRAVVRAIHFYNDSRRAGEIYEAIKADDFDRFLQLIIEGGHSSFEFNQNAYSIKNPQEQGVPLALAISQKVLNGRGAWRLQGGGFAGTIQAFVPLALLETYKNAIDAVFGAGSCHVLSVRNYGAVMVTPDM